MNRLRLINADALLKDVGSWCDTHEDCYSPTFLSVLKAVAFNCVEKQLVNGIFRFKCPVCEKEVEPVHKYCPECGTKIKWSDNGEQSNIV